MLQGENVCDLSAKVQSVLSTQNAESDVTPDPIDQKTAHTTAAIQLQVMLYSPDREVNLTRVCLSAGPV